MFETPANQRTVTIKLKRGVYAAPEKIPFPEDQPRVTARVPRQASLCA